MLASVCKKCDTLQVSSTNNCIDKTCDGGEFYTAVVSEKHFAELCLIEIKQRTGIVIDTLDNFNPHNFNYRTGKTS